MPKFTFGKFVYEYKLVKESRKTLTLVVAPDLSITLKCPEKATDERVQKFLKKKWIWLEKQLNYFKKFQNKVNKKEYLSGEEFFYLGKQYRLTIRNAKESLVKLTKRQIIVFTPKSIININYNKRILVDWLNSKTQEIFQKRYVEMLKRFDYKTIPTLSIRDMNKRWGSFLDKKRIYLNPKLIHTPRECIDYVIVHELCHMKYKNHDKKYWNLLEEKYPKWQKVKDRLEELGARL